MNGCSKIVNDNVKTTDENDQLSLMIYYKNTKTRNLIMKNNKVMQNKRQRTDEWLTVTNVVYKFSCPDEDCQLRKCSYIGATTTTMSRRITMHLNEGAPKAHMQQKHRRRITRTDFTDNITIMKRVPDQHRLFIHEAVLIKMHDPEINRQQKPTARLHLYC